MCPVGRLRSLRLRPRRVEWQKRYRKETMQTDSKDQPIIPREKPERRSLREEPFVGMWRDREDMTDSTEWVRQIRQREWPTHIDPPNGI